MSDAPKTDRETLPYSAGSGSGSECGYSVEARYNSHAPRVIAGQMLDNRWQKVGFARGSVIGVPGTFEFSGHRSSSGYFSYAQAQALRWWFIANAAAENNDICLETRLVKHAIEHTYKITATAAVEPISDNECRRPEEPKP